MRGKCWINCRGSKISQQPIRTNVNNITRSLKMKFCYLSVLRAGKVIMWAKHLGLDASDLGQVGRKPDENIVGHVRVSCLISLTELNVHSELCGSHTNGGQHHRDEGTGGCKDPGEKSSS